MKQKEFYVFKMMPVTDSEIQKWISRIMPRVSSLQRKEYTRQWNVIEKIRQENNK